MSPDYHADLDEKDKYKWSIEIQYDADQGHQTVNIFRGNLESYESAINWLANKLRTLPDDVNPTININQYHE